MYLWLWHNAKYWYTKYFYLLGYLVLLDFRAQFDKWINILNIFLSRMQLYDHDIM